MAEKILVVDDDPITLSWLKVVLEKEGFAVVTANRAQLALEHLEQERPNLMILDWILPDMDGMELLRHVRQNPEWRNMWIIVLSVKDRPEDVVAGLRAGADDYVPKRPGADVELIGKMRGLLAQPRAGTAESPATAPRPSGKIFSFCSAKGGTGTTSVCTNMAYALSQLEPRAQVLLVDMVFPVGTVGQATGYESTNTVAQLTCQTKGRFDRKTIENYVSPVQRWGFRVLLGASDPKEATMLEVNQIVPLFEALRGMYDYIIVDFGRTLSKISLPIIQTSEAIVIILTPDINTVKLTKATIAYLESLGVMRKRIVLVNNRTVGRVWISKEETENELKLPLAGTIPYESEYFTMATNMGIPFMGKFPEHAASMMFTEFARMLRDRAPK